MKQPWMKVSCQCMWLQSICGSRSKKDLHIYIYIDRGNQETESRKRRWKPKLWPLTSINWLESPHFFNFMRELSILSFPWVVRGNECVFYFPRAPRTRSEGVPRVPACWQGSFNWAIKTIYQWGCVGEFCFMATKKPWRSLPPLTLSIVRKSQSYCSKKDTWKFHLHVWAWAPTRNQWMKTFSAIFGGRRNF